MSQTITRLLIQADQHLPVARFCMRALLDTNIIIHREANQIVLRDIGILFNWLDRLQYEKCVHPLTLVEIKKHKDPNVVRTFETKIDSYNLLKTTAPDTPQILAIRSKYDKNNNDSNDTSLLSEVFSKRVDLLISEDRKIHTKANELGIAAKVFTVDSFLEKVVAEHPDLVNYKVLSVKKAHFGDLKIDDPFFESFKQDYQGFEGWFNRKADETAYICKSDSGDLLAFLYLKQEDEKEDYGDITPKFEVKKYLKIGTFKVIANGYKLGERFLKIVFDNAMQFKVDAIYVTIFDRTEDQIRLINLLKDWGFVQHGIKRTASGEEQVFIRTMMPHADIMNPCLTYPYVSKRAKKFIVPIYPSYHTELLPDSILRTESPLSFEENRPNRNAISKVYVSRSIERNLKPGDIIVFYRTKDQGAGFYTSVTTTIGVVQSVFLNIRNQDEFVELCRKRSVFSDKELLDQWNFKPNRPFIVNFLYVYTLPKKLILRDLQRLGIILDAPRGFEPLSDGAFQKLLENSNADSSFIID